VYVSIYSLGAYAFYRFYRKTKSKASRLCYAIGLPLLVFSAFFYTFNILPKFTDFSIPAVLSDVYLWIISLFGFITLFILVIEWRNRKKEKKEKKS